MKQLVYYYLCLKVLIKAVTGSYIFIVDSNQLPMLVYAVCALLVVSGTVVAIRHFRNKGKPNEIAFFFAAEAIGTLFNILFVSRTTLVETGGMDMIVTGSLLDVILAAAIVVIALKSKTAYINMGKQSFVGRPQEAIGKVR